MFVQTFIQYQIDYIHFFYYIRINNIVVSRTDDRNLNTLFIFKRGFYANNTYGVKIFNLYIYIYKKLLFTKFDGGGGYRNSVFVVINYITL